MVRMPRLAGFAGRLYPVNPAYSEIEGLPCHPSLANLPETVDHVVLGLANARLEAGLDEAIAHGARAVTIFASGHVDGDPGLGARIGERARAAGVALCGGNGMGFYNLDHALRVVAFDSPLDMRRGSIAYIAQSGSAFGALAHNDRRLGFNLAVSSGAEWATTAADYLDWALEQETTRAVGLFLETVRDPSGFAAGLEKAAAKEVPVVVLKVGRTPESAAMALSHTGALAGSDAAYEALFDRYGVLRVDDEDELAATLLLLSHRRRPVPGGLAAMHDSGGERELMVDINAGVGVPFARISSATTARLAQRLDPGLVPMNPLDAWGTGSNVADDFAELMLALVEDPDAALGCVLRRYPRRLSPLGEIWGRDAVSGRADREADRDCDELCARASRSDRAPPDGGWGAGARWNAQRAESSAACLGVPRLAGGAEIPGREPAAAWRT